MAKAYLETSALNRSLDAGVTPEKIVSTLQPCQPAVSTTTIYELARTFSAGNQERGQSLFRMLRSMLDHLVFLQPVSTMLVQEVGKMRSKVKPEPHLDRQNRKRACEDIQNLADGNSSRAEAFIQARDGFYRAVQPVQNQQYLDHVRQLRDKNPRIRSFDDVYSYFEDQLPNLIRDILRPHVKVANSEARKLACRLDECPTLRSCVRANCRVSFHHIVHDAPPGGDKWDDYRHIVCAAYCDVFVTADTQTAAAGDINPDLQVSRFDGLFSGLLPRE